MRVYVSSLIPEIRAEALYASDCVRLDDRSDRLRLNLFEKISSKTDNKLYSLIPNTRLNDHGRQLRNSEVCQFLNVIRTVLGAAFFPALTQYSNNI